MAEERSTDIPGEQPTAGSSNPDPYDWVADEPRTTPSRYAGCPDGDLPPGLFTRIEDPGHSFWDIAIPGKQRRVCHEMKAWGAFSMYQIAFEEFGYLAREFDSLVILRGPPLCRMPRELTLR
jgi:hypothetical protein